MKKNATFCTVLGSILLVTAQIAHASCVIPTGLPPNDVSLDGFAFEIVSATTPAFEVDMNGVQRDSSGNELWATHGVLLVLLDATGAPPQLIASWTKNTERETEEWVCRAVLDDTGIGVGAVHTLTPGAGTHTTQRFECKIDLANDCP